MNRVKTRPPTPHFETLGPLLRAEAAAEAAAAGIDPGDLEQAVWLRLFERAGAGDPVADPSRWLRSAVRAEARAARRRARREVPYGDETPAVEHGPEPLALAEEQGRVLRAAVRRLPGRCPRLLAALLHPRDLTYREIAGTLGMSQGSLGPERSRCLGCLRRMLAAEVAPHGPWGTVRGRQPVNR